MATSSSMAYRVESGNRRGANHFSFEQPYMEHDYSGLGINPKDPTEAKPGSPEKVAMLAARYAAGLPLWHNKDCIDHGPEIDLGFFDLQE